MTQIKVYAVSDIHTDFPTNWEYINALPSLLEYAEESVLIVCGDISDDLRVIDKTLRSLVLKYNHVFYVPGNHESWVGRSDSIQNSMDKLKAVLELSKKLGVHTGPVKLSEDLAIIPMLSWYHPSFDQDFCKLSNDQKAITYEETKKGWGDFRYCKWSMDALELPNIFMKENANIVQEFKKSIGGTLPKNVITFSHMVPRRELLPPRDKLLKKLLPMVVGCCELDTQLREFGSTCHVFGHTHIDYDVVIDNVRYVQNAFSAPQEREGWKKPYLTGPFQPKCIYSSSN